MKALIVEDDIIQLNGTAAMISNTFPDIECLKAASYDDAIHAIDSYDIQLFILDIQLGELEDKDGIEIGEYIRSKEEHSITPILYATALPNHAPRAIHCTNCYDYIVKPFTQEDLTSSIQKLLKLSLIQDPPVEVVDRNGVYTKLKPDRIFCIKSELRNMYVYSDVGTFVTSGVRLTEFASILPHYFIRCHKSYVINTHHIVSYDKTTSTIHLDKQNLRTIPVGRKYVTNIPENFRDD